MSVPDLDAGPTASALFVYGTLTDPATFKRVTGLAYVVAASPDEPSPAVLSGFEARCLDGRYLYAVPDEHGAITGRIVHGLTDELFARLDAYEGNGYVRTLETATVNGRPVEIYVYVAASGG